MSGAAQTPPRPLLSVDQLSLSLASFDGDVRVLDEASVSIMPGEIVGLVGESGCGKSTLVKAILGILPPVSRITGGEIRFEDADLLKLGARAMSRDYRARRIGFIPQDPYLALNPMFTVGAQLMEILRWHGRQDGGDWRGTARARIVTLFRRVGLPEPEAFLQRYPHQLSGGQRQRVLIAAALLCSPALIVADEPTTALDVTTQQQILRLLRELADELDVAVLFVTHDFGVVAELCSAVTVMYAGQTVETGTMHDVVFDAKHPYTRRLVACHPDRLVALEGIPGTVPSLIDPPAGCRFHPRCAESVAGCPERRPRLDRVSPTHAVNCIHFDRAAS